MATEPILICGVGPTGLAAALFLTERGFPVRIFDKKSTPSQFSRALAINARSLELLKQTGAPDKLSKLGLKTQGMSMWQDGKLVLKFDIPIETTDKYALIMAQSNVEMVLEQCLRDRNIHVESNTELMDLKILGPDKVSVTIKNPQGIEDIFDVKCLFASDGAHSIARAKLDVEFPGSTYEEDWGAYDVELDSPLDPNKAHVVLK